MLRRAGQPAVGGIRPLAPNARKPAPAKGADRFRVLPVTVSAVCQSGAVPGRPGQSPRERG
jgi:hypothetical protein